MLKGSVTMKPLVNLEIEITPIHVLYVTPQHNIMTLIQALGLHNAIGGYGAITHLKGSTSKCNAKKYIS